MQAQADASVLVHDDGPVDWTAEFSDDEELVLSSDEDGSPRATGEDGVGNANDVPAWLLTIEAQHSGVFNPRKEEEMRIQRAEEEAALWAEEMRLDLEEEAVERAVLAAAATCQPER